MVSGVPIATVVLTYLDVTSDTHLTITHAGTWPIRELLFEGVEIGVRRIKRMSQREMSVLLSHER